LAVHLAAVTATTKVIIDRARYLPADWAADEERREVAGAPEEIAFATKSQQAPAMVTDTFAAGLKARWFAGDEAYCGRELRRGIRVLGLGYTVGVAATYQVIDGTGRRREARKMINKVRPGQWMRRQTRHGTKGTREYDWAWLDVRPDDAPGENRNENEPGTNVLVARRHRYTGEVSCFRCWAPGDVSLGTLVEVFAEHRQEATEPASVVLSEGALTRSGISRLQRPPQRHHSSGEAVAFAAAAAWTIWLIVSKTALPTVWVVEGVDDLAGDVHPALQLLADGLVACLLERLGKVSEQLLHPMA
jgi:hypothetical protein